MSNNEFSRDYLITLIEHILVFAREAGERIMAVYEREFSVETKTDKSPVTEADMDAHEVIVNGLQNLPKAYPVLSEESVDIPFSARRRWETYWLVDPLDGTREFIKHNGEFTVNVALIHRHEAILGLVYAPVSELYYYAARGYGAYKQSYGGEPKPIHCRISAQKQPGHEHLVVIGSRSHDCDKLQRFLTNMGDYELRSMGSSLKSCMVAEGLADIYPRLGLTSEWDTAAAQCVVEEAGGHFTDSEGNRLRYNTKESLLNPSFLVFCDDTIDWISFIAPGDAKPSL
jgi:3'(2'), 5'-bisphosphate nucleotidase